MNYSDLGIGWGSESKACGGNFLAPFVSDQGEIWCSKEAIQADLPDIV